MDAKQRYQFRSELGSGGLGRVFLVHDRELGRDLALKMLHEQAEPAALDRFHAEFALLTRLQHPGIARAHDFGWIDGRPYFTSDYVEGKPLGSFSRIDDATILLEHARDLAAALAFLHRGSILHLDVKPSNVIVPDAMNGDAPRSSSVVLIDFGLFRGGPITEPLDRIQGSLPFMAPECFDGAGLGPWTDVYAFGVTIYKLLTGDLPRQGAASRPGRPPEEEDWTAVPPIGARLRAPLEKDFEYVVLKCLALAPGSRFANGGELCDALLRLEGGTKQIIEAPGHGWTVGRSADIATLDRFLEGSAGESNPPVLFITAQPGMGQTHFLHEAKLGAQRRSIAFSSAVGTAASQAAAGSLLLPLALHMPDDAAAARDRWLAFLSPFEKPRKPLREMSPSGERSNRWAGEVALAAQAIRDPLIIAVDGLQAYDEVSVTLFSQLARFLCELPPEERPPIRLIAAFREEGTCAPLLCELAAYLLEPGRSEPITLQPLGLSESVALLRQARGAGLEIEDAIAAYRECGGSPSRILASTVGDGSPGSSTPDASSIQPLRIDGLSARETEALAIAALLARPARAAELRGLAGWKRGGSRTEIAMLASAGLLVRNVETAESDGLAPSPKAMRWVERIPAARRRLLHRRIGAALCCSARGENDARLVEGVRHLRLGGERALLVLHGPRAARLLKARFQNRAAREVLSAVLDALPRGRAASRAETTLELADVESRLGETDKGIARLRASLEETRALRGSLRARSILELATLYGRRGDFRRSAELFQQALGGDRGTRLSLSRRHRLLFLNAYAAVRAFLGEYEESLRLCREGLVLARGDRSYEVREVALNLLATKASVAVRTLEPAAALPDFERALEIAESIGSRVNQAVILNNLGIVYSNSDRYAEAARALRDAAEISLSLDEGPSLVSIHANLAVLHAKLGDFPRMDAALSSAARLNPKAMGPRQEVFFEHAKGLCLLSMGRHGEARRRFERAALVGVQTGDTLLVQFDELYRGECLIFEGRYAEAETLLNRLGGSESPASIRSQALARHAFLCAVTARENESRRKIEACSSGEDAGRPPYIQAWNALFLGWAKSILGEPTEILRDALGFFDRHGLKPAAALASWVEAEAHLLRGETSRAREALASRRRSGTDLTSVIRPLLEARLELEASPSAKRLVHLGDLLVEAGSALRGNPLPEWDARLSALRAAISEDGSSLSAAAAEARGRLARELPAEARKAYLECAHWRVWTGFRSKAAATSSPRPTRAPPAETTTAGLASRTSSSPRGKLVARSSAMARVVSFLDRIRSSSLPVLIRGESGSGKELIARIVHEESAHARGPFLVLDCAAIPDSLLESELFGAKAGAFTDLASDRLGLLTAAAGGTLLADEICGASLEAQAKLLRVLSDRFYRPLGGEEMRPVEARWIFSTSRNLEGECKAGRFREDLLHRVHVLSVEAPPLRERLEDLEELARVFLEELRAKPTTIAPAALALLKEHAWPGNVRELRNLIARLALESTTTIHRAAVEKALGPPRRDPDLAARLLSSETLGEAKRRLEREYILHHLERLKGDTTALSRLLGVNRQQLYRRLRRLGLKLRSLQRSR